MSVDSDYPTYRAGTERIALVLVMLVLVGLPLGVAGFRAVQNARGPARVIEITGRLPTADQGGWTPERIEVLRGERIRLRVTSADVVHGFAIPKLGVDLGWVEPGKVKEVEFVAHRPGRYDFLCTTWCQSGHWRMRGTLEVADPDDPVASTLNVDPPQTDWVATGIDIDADHPGAVVPSTPPDAAAGAALWSTYAARPPTEAAADLDLRMHAPSDVYGRLAEPGLLGPAADRLSAEARWDAVAHLWHAASGPEALKLGKQLFERDCTGCHGQAGRGDGPGADALAQQAEFGIMGQLPAGAPAQGADPRAMDHDAKDNQPVDFTDLANQAGASDLLYYAKIVRGGMGTFMPYFGTIHTEDELWSLVAYLRSFAFRYPPAAD